MLSEKIPVDQKLIKKLIKKNFTPYAISKMHKIPLSVILNIRKGKDKSFYQKRIKENIAKEDLCTCCGRRKKGEGLRFLCDLCFKSGKNNDLESASTGLRKLK